MEETQICPFCREQIKGEAIKCRFCGEWLDRQKGSVSPTPARVERTTEAPTEHPRTVETTAVTAPALPSEMTVLGTAPIAQMGYTFAKVYAAMCLIFSASIALGLVANVEVTLWPAGRTNYPGLVRTLSFGFMIGLYLATAIAILKRRPSAVVLVNTGAIVGALGILARGLVPIDFMLYIPTAIAVGYFHRRKNLLLGIASGLRWTPSVGQRIG